MTALDWLRSKATETQDADIIITEGEEAGTYAVTFRHFSGFCPAHMLAQLRRQAGSVHSGEHVQIRKDGFVEYSCTSYVLRSEG